MVEFFLRHQQFPVLMMSVRDNGSMATWKRQPKRDGSAVMATVTEATRATLAQALISIALKLLHSSFVHSVSSGQVMRHNLSITLRASGTPMLCRQLRITAFCRVMMPQAESGPATT